jgi:hypothetical protein
MGFARVRFQKNIVADEKGNGSGGHFNTVIARDALLGFGDLKELNIESFDRLRRTWKIFAKSFRSVVMAVADHDHLKLLCYRLRSKVMQAAREDCGALVGRNYDA